MYTGEVILFSILLLTKKLTYLKFCEVLIMSKNQLRVLVDAL